MKSKLIISLCLLSSVAMAQQIQVGDSVRVKTTTERYLTGERISKWVYGEAHVISQVGTKRWSNGVLLNIQGARSWLGQDDVILIGQSEPIKEIAKQEEVQPQPQPLPEPQVELQPEPEPEPEIQPEPQIEVAQKPIEEVKPASSKPAKPTKSKKEVAIAKKESPVHFQMNGNLGLVFREVTFGAEANLVFGARINPYFFVGGGFGFNGWVGGQSDMFRSALQCPIFADFKGYLPISGREFAPFLNFAIGGTLGQLKYATEPNLKNYFYTGLYSKVGVGLDMNKWNFCVGYEYGPGREQNKMDYHYGFVSIGFAFPNK